ncbi:MAG TPA: trigger factor [Chitinivibrionales bacterium]|nr:trigger factor [Chitinivibrionales bacterium]
MKVSVSEPKSFIRILDIEIPKEEVESEFTKKLATYTRKAALPGFRPGKTPPNLIRSRFGKSIYSESVEDLVERSFEDACKQHSIFPISKGKISNLKADEGAPVSFTVEFEIDPPVEIRGYQNLGISADPKKIKDGDVEKAVEDLRQRNAELRDVSRPAEKGDSVAIEYFKVVIDGVERKDFSNPKYPIELGAGEIKDFDKGIIGHSAGEAVDIAIRFPKDFSTKDLAGKDAFFSVKINAVKEKVVPELTPEFLKKLGDFADAGALSEAVRKDLERREKERAKNEAYGKAIEKLIDKNHFEVPEARIQAYLDHMADEVTRYLRPGEAPPTREELEQKYRATAERGIMRYKIIDFVAAQEKIKATQEEVDRQVQALADAYKQPFEQLKQRLRENGTTNRIRADIREQKTLDFLIGEYTPGKIEESGDKLKAEG